MLYLHPGGTRLPDDEGGTRSHQKICARYNGLDERQHGPGILPQQGPLLEAAFCIVSRIFKYTHLLLAQGLVNGNLELRGSRRFLAILVVEKKAEDEGIFV